MQKLLFLALLGFWATNACKKHDECDITSIPTDTIYVHDTIHPMDNYVPAVKLFGLNFSPYQDDQDPNNGVTIPQDQIKTRLEIIKNFTQRVRTFGATHGLEEIPRLAREKGMKVYAGAWLGSDLAANDAEIANLIAIGKAGHAEALVVGSEVLLRGDLTPQQLIDYINTVRAAVPQVPVTTADTYGKLLEHPEVRAACDFLFVNIYPLWEGVQVECAVYRLHAAWQSLVSAANGKEVILSETGWSSEGLPIGAAAPSETNACLYFENVAAWSKAMNVKAFYFSATDEPWKAAHEGELGAHWGIFDNAGKLKPCMKTVFDGAASTKFQTCLACTSPQIVLSHTPKYGTSENLRGSVSCVNPADHNVAVYIKVAGGWWTKPYYAQKKTPISSDGSWVTDITTGGNDASATEIAAFLIPNAYDPPTMQGAGSLPAALEQNALAWVSVTRSP